MKAIILAAGKAARVESLSRAIPKALFPLGKTPVIQHILDEIVQAGIEEIALVCNPEHKWLFQTAIKSIPHVGISFWEQKEPNGPVDALQCGVQSLIHEDFLLVLADSVMLPDGIVSVLPIRTMMRLKNCVLVQHESEDIQKYGVIIPLTNPENGIFESGGLVEKPDNPLSLYAIAGRYVLPPALFDYFAQGDDWPTALNKCIKQAVVLSNVTRYDVGTHEGYQGAWRAYLRENR